MKKLLFIIAAIFIFTACCPTNTVYIDTSGTQEVYIDMVKARMQVPKHFHMDIQRRVNGEPRAYAIFGEDYHSNGQLIPMIRFTFEHEEYEEYMAENWDAPFFALENACEVETPKMGEIFGCDTFKDNITEYYLTEKMGDVGAVKNYYFTRDNNEYHEVEVWVDLLTPDFEEKITSDSYEDVKAEFQKSDLTEEQKRRIQMTEDIIESMEL